MFHLPHSTEINRALPKTILYEKFNLAGGKQRQFDADVSKMALVHRIDAETVPAVQRGKGVESIWVLAVTLKNRSYNPKNIEMLFKLIPQRMVLALLYGIETQLAMFEGMMVTAPWRTTEDIQLSLQGLDLDSVWNHLMAQVANVEVTEGKNVREQIEDAARHEALQKKIAALEDKARKETQPHRKMGLFEEIQKLKKALV